MVQLKISGANLMRNVRRVPSPKSYSQPGKAGLSDKQRSATGSPKVAQPTSQSNMNIVNAALTASLSGVNTLSVVG